MGKDKDNAIIEKYIYIRVSSNINLYNVVF